MEQWYCFKCKEAMLEENINLSYLEMTRPVKGLKCPKCGTAYLLEDKVEGVVRRGEEALETK